MKANINIRCSKENLAVVRDFVKQHLTLWNITGKVSDQIILATDEACANCIIHHHQCDINASIEVSISLESESVYVEIKDQGQAFPIHQYQPRRIEDMIQKRKKGGLGIFLINKLMDEVLVEEGQGYFIYKLGKHVKGLL